jgi:ribulose-phosphate 3-epimerase
MIKIAPSLASGPQSHLANTIQQLEDAGADIIHFDVEDGHFVPEMNIGIKMIKVLRPLTALPFDVHLMVDKPEWLIPRVIDYGADMVSVHYEACAYPRRTLGLIHARGVKAGLALNPKTPLPEISFFKDFLSFMLILTTDPEEGHCSYLPSVLAKVRDGKDGGGFEGILWEVDGGFSAENIEDALSAGADIVVSGRGVFAQGAVVENIKTMKEK